MKKYNSLHHSDTPYALLAVGIFVVFMAFLPQVSIAAVVGGGGGGGGTTYSVACPSQPQPIGQTFDGFPAFNMNFCPGSAVWSNDGKNTYSYDPGGASHLSNTSAGYQCWELASRYFHFKWKVDISGAVAADLCPGGSGTITGPATRTTNPMAGDLIVYGPNGSPHLSGGSGGNCAGVGSAGHIAVVNKVNTDGTVDTVNQNFGVDPLHQSNGYFTVNKDCACTFIHATANNGTGNNCNTPTVNSAPTGTYSTQCPAQPSTPGGVTFDGYPAFNWNRCEGSDHGVGSLDGKQTYDYTTKIGYVNGAAKDFHADIAANPGAEYKTWWSSYVCDELAHRYFHFKYKLDIEYPDYPYRLCPQEGSGSFGAGNVIPASGSTNTAVETQTPTAGDVVVFSTYEGPGISMNNPKCTQKWFVSSSHIGLVNKVNSDGTIQVISQNVSSQGDSPFDTVDASCACTYIHAQGAGSSTSGSGGQCVQEPYALATYQTGPASALDINGKLVVFVRSNSDNKLYYKVEKKADNTTNQVLTNNWPTDKDPATNNSLWISVEELAQQQNSSATISMMSDPVVTTHWSVDESGAPVGSSSNITMLAGEIEVFYIGTDGGIWRAWQTNKAGLGDKTKDKWNVDEVYNPATDSAVTKQGVPLTQAHGVPASQVSVFQENSGNWLFFVDPFKTIYTVYRNVGPGTIYDPTQKYGWSKPASISKENVASSNITGAWADNGLSGTYIFFVGSDKSVQYMQGPDMNSHSDLGWTAPKLFTDNANAPAGTQPPPKAYPGTSSGAATSNITVTGDPAGGLAVFFRGRDMGIWEVTGAGTYHGGRDIAAWSGEWNPPMPIYGNSSSDTAVGGFYYGANGWLQLFYRNNDGGLQSVKQVGPRDPNTYDPRWDKHFRLLGNYGPNAMKNTTALPYLTNEIFSIVNHGYNANMTSEIFYVDFNGDIQHMWETQTPYLQIPFVRPAGCDTNPNLPQCDPNATLYPTWGGPENLGQPPTNTTPANNGLSGYNPYCDYLNAGGLDQAGEDFIAKYEGTISGCYCDPVWGCGSETTWGIGTVWTTRNSCTANGHYYSTVCPNSNPCGEYVSYDDAPRGFFPPLQACGVPATDFLSCAESVMKEIALEFMKLINNEIPCDKKLTQNQFDALASLAYNCGPGTGGCAGPAIYDIVTGSPPYQAAADYIASTASFRVPARAQAEAVLFCTGSADPANGVPACTVP